MVTNQDYGASLVGGAIALGFAGMALGAAENIIRHRGKLKVGKTSRRILPARIFRGKRRRVLRRR